MPRQRQAQSERGHHYGRDEPECGVELRHRSGKGGRSNDKARCRNDASTGVSNRSPSKVRTDDRTDCYRQEAEARIERAPSQPGLRGEREQEKLASRPVANSMRNDAWFCSWLRAVPCHANAL